REDVRREAEEIIARETGARLTHELPDVTVKLALQRRKASVWVRPLYVRGRYRKRVRGIPQSRWLCRVCKGRGGRCSHCGGTGRLYETSVEEQLGHPFAEACGASRVTLHAAGREDVDARMLGAGRPFVLEIARPQRRGVDLAAVARFLATKHDVDATAIRLASRGDIARLKGAARQKSYVVLIEAASPGPGLAEINGALAALLDTVIKQQTPERVLHRRADVVRNRNVHSARVRPFGRDRFVVRLRCDGGLYVKELISGDGGRTAPSLTSLAGHPCRCAALDVVGVHQAVEG
ncbi:tRNA pseudouridine(54/55) synthase Pus10, partial [Planctomycetota bacterium]